MKDAERRRFLGGIQSERVKGLNEGLVRHLYGSGMSLVEVAAEVGASYQGLRHFMIRCGIPRRVAAKRDQIGAKNATWKGESIGYKGAHNRVSAARGKPRLCEDCGTTTAPRYDWANLTGKYHDPQDYARLCRPCHCKRDGLIKNLGTYAKEPSNGIRV